MKSPGILGLSMLCAFSRVSLSCFVRSPVYSHRVSADFGQAVRHGLVYSFFYGQQRKGGISTSFCSVSFGIGEEEDVGVAVEQTWQRVFRSQASQP